MAQRTRYVGASVLSLCCLWSVGGVVLRGQNSSHLKEQTKAADKSDSHACLAGKRIVFVGPSTSKFDYIALAYFAEFGVWPSTEQVTIGPGKIGPNPLYEWNIRTALQNGTYHNPELTAAHHRPGCNDGGGTEAYMRYTNGIFHGHEMCDCHFNGQWKDATDSYNSTENRIYSNGNTMISYFQWLGEVVPPRGTLDITPALTAQPQPVHPPCPVGQFPGNWAWNMPLPDFLAHVVKYAAPTHLVVSAAFWPSHPDNAPYWDGIAKAGAAAVGQSNGKAFWRTTPMRTDHPPTDPSAMVDTARFLQNGWSIFPAGDIIQQNFGSKPSEETFYDFTHLKPGPESLLVQTFVNQFVCPATR